MINKTWVVFSPGRSGTISTFEWLIRQRRAGVWMTHGIESFRTLATNPQLKMLFPEDKIRHEGHPQVEVVCSPESFLLRVMPVHILLLVRDPIQCSISRFLHGMWSTKVMVDTPIWQGMALAEKISDVMDIFRNQFCYPWLDAFNEEIAQPFIDLDLASMEFDVAQGYKLVGEGSVEDKKRVMVMRLDRLDVDRKQICQFFGFPEKPGKAPRLNKGGTVSIIGPWTYRDVLEACREEVKRPYWDVVRHSPVAVNLFGPLL